jgi:hypothetical protein
VHLAAVARFLGIAILATGCVAPRVPTSPGMRLQATGPYASPTANQPLSISIKEPRWASPSELVANFPSEGVIVEVGFAYPSRNVSQVTGMTFVAGRRSRRVALPNLVSVNMTSMSIDKYRCERENCYRLGFIASSDGAEWDRHVMVDISPTDMKASVETRDIGPR